MKLWPTATVNGNHNRRGASANSGNGLSTEVKLWLTPGASDGKRTADYKPEDMQRGKPDANLNQQLAQQDASGHLNPDWVEPLMGFPKAYTDPNKPTTPVPFNQFFWENGKWEEGIPRVTQVTEYRADRLKALGNAVVPQQAYPLFKAIVEWERKELICLSTNT